MSQNKALQMDPHDSRVVTEYSAKQGSSGFSCGYWPGMDTARMLLTLKQGLRSLEDYIQEYLDLAHFSDLPDCMLIDFFCEGINQPLKSRLIREGPRSSLSQFMDYALLTVGSAFTVGVDEERDTAPVTEMADAPECTHKMADTTTHRHFSVDVKEPSQVPADVKEPSEVTADVKEPSQVPADVKEPSQVTAIVKGPSQVTTDVNESSQATVDCHESSQATVDRRESGQVTVDRRESSQVTFDRRESSQVTADVKKPRQVTAIVKEPSQVTADVNEPSQATVDRHESIHLTADQPESHHVTADQPESHHVTADQPESHHVTADQPESHHVTADQPESHHVTADQPESLHVSALQPESLHVSALQPESLHVSALQPESLHVSALQPESLHVSALQPESLHVSALQPESLHVSALQPESLHVSALQPESLHVSALQPESLHVSAEMPESVTPRDLRSVLRVPCLVSSVRDAPLVSARAAGIPKPTHFSPPVPELIPLPVVLPTMGIALWCIWAAYTTTEILETAAATKMSPEVAADAAEPPGVVVHAAVFPEAMPAAVSPEVAADAAEPTEAAVLLLIPCMVVAPSNALAACQVTVKGTITEFSASVETQDGTAVEPLEVAASTAEPPEVSVVSTYQLSPCPVTAKEAVCELSPCPVTAKEAVCELSPCPVTAKEAVCELTPCPVTAKDAVCELSPCPVTAKEAVCELSPCLVTATETGFEPLNPPIMSPEFIGDFLVFSAMDALSVSCVSMFPRSQSLPWSSGPSVPPWRSSALSPPPWWAPVPSAPPWWAPVPSAPPWCSGLPALPQPPVSPLPHGPGPPSLPLFRLRSTAILDCIRASGSRSLGGGGYVTNPVHAIPFTHHQRSLVHHIDSYTTLLLPFTIELHFPSSTALTQLFALITLTPENSHTITITQSHTLYKPWTSSCSRPSIVLCLSLS